MYKPHMMSVITPQFNLNATANNINNRNHNNLNQRNNNNINT